MTRQMMFVGLLVLSSIYGVARGGRPEQIGAATLALGVLASIVFSHPVTLQFQSVEVGMLAVDAAMLGVFLWLSFKSTRFWPAWVSGMLMAEVAVLAADLDRGPRELCPDGGAQRGRYRFRRGRVW